MKFSTLLITVFFVPSAFAFNSTRCFTHPQMTNCIDRELNTRENLQKQLNGRYVFSEESRTIADDQLNKVLVELGQNFMDFNREQKVQLASTLQVIMEHLAENNLISWDHAYSDRADRVIDVEKNFDSYLRIFDIINAAAQISEDFGDLEGAYNRAYGIFATNLRELASTRYSIYYPGAQKLLAVKHRIITSKFQIEGEQDLLRTFNPTDSNSAYQPYNIRQFYTLTDLSQFGHPIENPIKSVLSLIQDEQNIVEERSIYENRNQLIFNETISIKAFEQISANPILKGQLTTENITNYILSIDVSELQTRLNIVQIHYLLDFINRTEVDLLNVNIMPLVGRIIEFIGVVERQYGDSEKVENFYSLIRRMLNEKYTEFTLDNIEELLSHLPNNKDGDEFRNLGLIEKLLKSENEFNRVHVSFTTEEIASVAASDNYMLKKIILTNTYPESNLERLYFIEMNEVTGGFPLSYSRFDLSNGLDLTEYVAAINSEKRMSKFFAGYYHSEGLQRALRLSLENILKGGKFDGVLLPLYRKVRELDDTIASAIFTRMLNEAAAAVITPIRKYSLIQFAEIFHSGDEIQRDLVLAALRVINPSYLLATSDWAEAFYHEGVTNNQKAQVEGLKISLTLHQANRIYMPFEISQYADQEELIASMIILENHSFNQHRFLVKEDNISLLKSFEEAAEEMNLETVKEKMQALAQRYRNTLLNQCRNIRMEVNIETGEENFYFPSYDGKIAVTLPEGMDRQSLRDVCSLL